MDIAKEARDRMSVDRGQAGVSGPAGLMELVDGVYFKGLHSIDSHAPGIVPRKI